jgi:DTW domain-containing protein YfiP
MSRARCPRCERPLGHCLCALIPQLPSRTRVLILQHPSEAAHALNTARLASLGLPNSELRRGEHFTGLQQLLDDPRWQSCLLFPGENAVALSDFSAASALRPLQLVVPDGTWRKARKLLYLNPALAALPRVTLGNPPASRYRLRKTAVSGGLSTIEAIALALQEIEGTADFSALLKPFDALIEGQIAAMGVQTYERNYPVLE